ncbi:MAG TPA: HAD-IC family P-type ATPase [Solirubrobacteraceae bacterium]|nr:HAD-IC family P-type ATPase [Solirubrobacteraceae bacterium]
MSTGLGQGSETDRLESSQAALARTGLSEQEAARRLAARGRPQRERSSRSYASIVRANVLTVFNTILAAFGAVTLIFGDWRDALFLGVIVANSGIGITQEVRAKRALDRLSLLVAPDAAVLRDGAERRVPAGEIVPGDVVVLAPGDQVLADGRLLVARDLRLDESILSGESEPAARAAGEEVRSGAFVTDGAGACEVTAVGAESFAVRLTGEARSFRHPRSPLQRAIDRLLYVLVVLVIALGALLGYSLYHRHVPRRTAVSTSAAGVVSLIPEGLVVLVSLTYAVAAVRMSRRGVLAQQLNAIESLASVDTICVDKTGTLTEAALRVVEAIPAAGVEQRWLEEALGRVAASASSRNATLQAIADAFAAQGEEPLGEIPFSSRRRFSAVALREGVFFLGAPERLELGALAGRAQERQREGRRVLAIARGHDPLPEEEGERLPPELQALGLVVIAEELRPGVGETIAFLRREGVEVRVLSGDAPQTVAAIARDVGIPVTGVSEGEAMPSDPAELRGFAVGATVVGRISPEGKQAFVQALHEEGRYVAMVGDGVNDVPALKSSRLAIAQGSGTQMARSVADLVLVSGDFQSVPLLVVEGRRALRNLRRVTKLYVTKSAFAAFLILTIGTSSDAYPLLPRHLTLAASLTIGIPTFFLALAPSSGPWRPERFVRGVARFAVPAGVVVGTGVVAGYLFALHDLDLAVGQARTVAVTILVACGLYLVMALEAEGSLRRSTLVGGMCAVLAGLYVLALLLPSTRRFFALTVPDAGMIATSVLASALSMGALALCGFTWRIQPTSLAETQP